MKERKMPAQKPGKSKQDYGTPDDLLKAVRRRWGDLYIDLAATKKNTVTGQYITPEQNSLNQDWVTRIEKRNTAWLNPPFANIEVWVKKCSEAAHPLAKKKSRILFLTPASVGSNWFYDYVYGKGYTTVMPLLPRLTFKGCVDPYPKDCMITVFGYQGHLYLNEGEPHPDLGDTGFFFYPWRWRDT